MKIKMFKNCIPIDVYKRDGVDCTNNGITSRTKELYLVSEDVTVDAVIEYCENNKDIAPEMFVQVRTRIVGYSNEVFRHLTPLILEDDYQLMFGGNFAYSSDARFCRWTDSKYPLPVFDRMED